MVKSPDWLLLYHPLLIVIVASIGLFGTWVGMRHFARARASEGVMRLGWLFMGSLGTAAALWASTLISIIAQAPAVQSGFELAPLLGSMVVALGSCFLGFEIGSRKHLTLAPELGGVVVGAGILAVHLIGLRAWHVAGTLQFGWFGIAATIAIGLGLGALSVSRANRPVTRYCRHGAAIVLTAMICAMHLIMTQTGEIVADPSVVLTPDLVPAHTMAVGVVGAMILIVGVGFASYLIDLRTRSEAAERIHVLSFNDAMTGLPNRAAFAERLEQAALESHELAHKLAVLVINLGGFKDINAVWGQAVGDRLMVEAAERMRRTAAGAFIGRLGGDEFVALQMSGDQPADGQALAERLAADLAMPFEAGGKELKIAPSIGYAVFPLDAPAHADALGLAKLALDRAKAGGRGGGICRYNASMDDQARERRVLASDLAEALGKGELELHYQLQVGLTDGAMRGAEALMRWRHPTRGMISPAHFIPMAEESELIIPMGEWALRTACRAAADGTVPGVVAVNLSPVQFRQRDLARMVQSILLDTGLPPARLEIEVTESMLMQDQAAALHTLRQLKAMGVAIAMDDFGTGYSSLATLHAFPFDKIKLDQSFVRRLPSDQAAVAIVRTILALGRSLNAPVLAEGIETPEQWRFLAAEGCQEGQGYLFARPVAPAMLGEAAAKLVQVVAAHGTPHAARGVVRLARDAA